MLSHAHSVKSGFALPRLVRALVSRITARFKARPKSALRARRGPGLVADLARTFRGATRID